MSDLETTGRRFRPQRTRRAVRLGSDINPKLPRKIDMAKPPTTLSNTGREAARGRAAPSRIRLFRAVSHEHTIAMLEFIDDLLLPRQRPDNGIEFAPSYKGEAVDKFQM